MKNKVTNTIKQTSGKTWMGILDVWHGALDIIKSNIMPIVSQILLGAGFTVAFIQNVKGLHETVIFTGGVLLSVALVATAFKNKK